MGFGFDLLKNTEGSLADEFARTRNQLDDARRQMDSSRESMLRQKMQIQQLRGMQATNHQDDMVDAMRYINQQVPSGLGQIQAMQAMRDSLVWGNGAAQIQWDPSQAAGLQQYHYKADWSGQAQLSEVDQMIAELRHRVDTFKL